MATVEVDEKLLGGLGEKIDERLAIFFPRAVNFSARVVGQLLFVDKYAVDFEPVALAELDHALDVWAIINEGVGLGPGDQCGCSHCGRLDIFHSGTTKE